MANPEPAGDNPEGSEPLERNPARIGAGVAIIAVVLVAAGVMAVVAETAIVRTFAALLIAIGIYRVVRLLAVLRASR